MRIGVNALYLIPGGVGGTEIYLVSLLDALAAIDPINEYFVFVNQETSAASLLPTSANFRIRPEPIRAVFRPARIVWEQTGLVRNVWGRKLDVLLNPGFTAPLFPPCPQVTVFHDLQHVRHPEHFRRWDLPFWRMLLYGAAHRSRSLIAVSEATRRDLLSHYGLHPDKVTVVPHGVDETFFEISGERRPEPVILCVSTLHPHKNLDRLIRAFAAAGSDLTGYRLVIAGLRGFYADELDRLISSLGQRDRVTLTGWIPRRDLYDLFRRADAFVYPSTFEGFGMPVLEAFAAGIPTACSAIDPLSDITGNAALLFDPASERAIAESLVRLAHDSALRERLTMSGRLRAREFSWRAAAEKTLAVLRTAAGL